MQHKLAEIREGRNIGLAQIAAETKIGLAKLQAIEAGDYQQLPGGIYNISYIRQYARFVGLDEEALLAEYQLQLGNPSQPLLDQRYPPAVTH